MLVLLSLLLQPSRADIRQAKVFMDTQADAGEQDFELSLIRVSQLQALLITVLERTPHLAQFRLSSWCGR